jgi:hypothetical protein
MGSLWLGLYDYPKPRNLFFFVYLNGGKACCRSGHARSLYVLQYYCHIVRMAWKFIHWWFFQVTLSCLGVIIKLVNADLGFPQMHIIPSCSIHIPQAPLFLHPSPSKVYFHLLSFYLRIWKNKYSLRSTIRSLWNLLGTLTLWTLYFIVKSMTIGL